MSGVTLGLSYVIAVTGFEHHYYFAQIIPIFLVIYLFLAWLVYLRRDDFLSFVGKRDAPVVHTLGNVEPGESQGLSEDKLAGREVTNKVLIKDGLVQRKGNQEEAEDFWSNMMYVFFWSAVQLALVSVVLYRFYGIGATL